MTFLALVLFARAALQGPIVSVEVEGNRLVSEETIRYYLGPLEDLSPEDAFRRLWETRLFEDLRMETEPADGGLRLVVVVEEKKLLGDVRLSGASLQELELREALRRAGFPHLPGRPFGEDEARRLARATEQILGPGYRVEPELTERSPTQVDLELEVVRIELPKISSIAFEGNETLDDETLLDAMELRPTSWIEALRRRDRFTPRELEEDLETLRALYRSLGFAFASVGPPVVDRRPEGVSIVVPIREGRRYRFGAFEISPGPLLTERRIREWLPATGSVFDGAALQEVIERIERHYRTRGYPSVRVDVLERPDPSGESVLTSLDVEEGPFVRVRRILFTGNERHRDSDLRALLPLAEADRFDARKLEAGVSALMSLGHFDAVLPEVDFTAGPHRVDVLYHLDEIDPFEYLVGGGLNGTQGASGNGQFIARSVLGRSETIRFDLDLGNRFQNFGVSYRDPSSLRSLLGALGNRLLLLAELQRASVSFPDDTAEDTLDVSVGVGGPLGSRLQLAGLQRFSAFTLDSSLEEDVPFLTSFIGKRFHTARTVIGITFDSRDRPAFPSRGRSVELSYELVTLDVSAHRVRSFASQILPLDRRARHAIALAARAGGVWSFGRTREEGLPRFERLFLGSENDLRGFDIRAVGPRSGNVVVGGDRLFYASAEYRFAPFERLRLVGFVDTGNVWATDFEGEALPRLRYDAGGEVRFLVPAANVPLRVGYGRNLDPLPEEPPGRFYVTLAVRF